jgi:hypothetical protein
MHSIDGICRIDFINSDGSISGSQNGLIISNYNQSILFSPFNINKNHFTHAKNAICTYKDNVIELTESRLSFPFLLRIWNITLIEDNPISKLTINFPKKNHILDDIKLDSVNDININFWHCILPSIFVQEINKIVDVGSVIHNNNKVTGIIVMNYQEKSIIISTYILKQLINGHDYLYSSLYYGLSFNNNNQIYVKQNWNQYENCLVENDIILEIENNPIHVYHDVNGRKPMLYYEKFDKDIYIDSWITCTFMEKDKEEIKIKVLRNNIELCISVPRKPLYNEMQIPYYSNNEDQLSFEKLSIYSKEERYSKIGYDLQRNPHKLFV